MSRPVPGRVFPTVPRQARLQVASPRLAGRAVASARPGRGGRSEPHSRPLARRLPVDRKAGVPRPIRDMARHAELDASGVASWMAVPVSWCPIGDVDSGSRERLPSLKRSGVPPGCSRACACVHLNDWRLTRSGTASSRMRTSITDVLSLRIASARAWSNSPLFSTRMPAQPNARAISA